MSYIRSTDTSEEVVSETGVTGPILKLTNTVADKQFFVTTATPEGAITANIGDSATDTVNGVEYLKVTGTGTNTGWSAFSAGGGQDAFLQTANTFSLAFGVTRFSSLSGGSIVSTESLVSLPQFAGSYTGIKLKVISNSLDGATTVRLRVNGANAGPAVTIAAAVSGTFSDTTTGTIALDDLVNLSFSTAPSTSGTIVIAGVMTRIGAN